MMVPPFSVFGEFMRQNGPSKLAVVSVWPLLPLLSRHTSAEKPSEPDISTTSLCVSLVSWPILAMSSVPLRNSSSVRCTSRAKACRCLTSAATISRSRGSSIFLYASSTTSVTSACDLMIIASPPTQKQNKTEQDPHKTEKQTPQQHRRQDEKELIY